MPSFDDTNLAGSFISERNKQLDTEWQQLLEHPSAKCAPPFFSKLNQKFYEKCSPGNEFEDVSLVLDDNGRQGGMQASVHKDVQGRLILSNWGLPLIWLGDSSSGLQKALGKQIERLVESRRIDEVHSVDLLFNGTYSTLSLALMNKAGSITALPRFICSLDLNLSEDVLHAAIRKSYRHCINRGLKRMEITTLTAATSDFTTWDNCIKLHREVAGRETRSIESWKVQESMIRTGEAFAVLGCLGGRIVGFSLFLVQRGYCFYWLAASRRETAGEPVSHALIWTAILHAKQIGCHLIELGPAWFPDNTQPSEKERSIGLFKAGFGGVVYPQIEINWQPDKTCRPAEIS